MRNYLSVAAIGLMLVSLVPVNSSLAATHYVSPSGANIPPYTNWATAAKRIHEAVSASVDGDTVLVTNGTYGLSADIMINPIITVRSVNGPASTIVDGSNTVRCFTLNNYNITVNGFTIMHGFTGQWGGGVKMSYGGTLRNCIVRSNAAFWGGGVYSGGSSSIIGSCTIDWNYASGEGGGMFLSPSSSVWNCSITDNRANTHGGGARIETDTLLSRCLIRGNAQTNAIGGGGGVLLNGRNNRLENSLVVSNSAKGYSGGVYASSSSTVVNCTISYNTAIAGGGVSLYAGARITNSIVYFNASGVSSNIADDGSGVADHLCTAPSFGANCVTADPMFVNPSAGNYHLRFASPCIETGVRTYTAEAVDLDSVFRPCDGNGDGVASYDLGCYEFVQNRLVKDYNGDGQADLSVYYGAGSSWYIRPLAGPAIAFGTNWGFAGVTPVHGDFNKDGKTDLAVFSPSSGGWYIRTMQGSILAWGTNWGFNGCVPVVGDYSGDSQADLALFHPVTGNWYIRTLSGATVAWATNWGFNGCTVVPGDFSGDGRSDLALFYPPNGCWYIRTLSGSVITFGESWGFNGCIPVPGDYDGDGLSDLALFYPAAGTWYIRSRTVSGVLCFGTTWGFNGCIPVSMDADGDGKSDLAVYYPANGTWYIRTVQGQVLAWGVNWGGSAMAAVKP